MLRCDWHAVPGTDAFGQGQEASALRRPPSPHLAHVSSFVREPPGAPACVCSGRKSGGRPMPYAPLSAARLGGFLTVPSISFRKPQRPRTPCRGSPEARGEPGSATERQAGEQGTGDLETTASVLGSGETEAQRSRDCSRSHSESERGAGLSRSTTPSFNSTPILSAPPLAQQHRCVRKPRAWGARCFGPGLTSPRQVSSALGKLGIIQYLQHRAVRNSLAPRRHIEWQPLLSQNMHSNGES